MKDKKLLAFIIPFCLCLLVLAYAYRGYSAEQLSAGISTADIKRMELVDYQTRVGLVKPAGIAEDARTVYAGPALFFENPMASSGTDPIYAEWVYEGSAQLRYEGIMASGTTYPVKGKRVNEGSARLEPENLVASTKFSKQD